jgi:hypothetical protein
MTLRGEERTYRGAMPWLPAETARGLDFITQGVADALTAGRGEETATDVPTTRRTCRARAGGSAAECRTRAVRQPIMYLREPASVHDAVGEVHW